MKLVDIRRFLCSVSEEEISNRTKRSIPRFEIELLYRVICTLPIHVRGIVEIGTYRGWSALWLAAAAQERECRLVSVDIDPVASLAGRMFLETAGLDGVAEFMTGDSTGLLRNKGHRRAFPVEATPNVWLIDGNHSFSSAGAEYECAAEDIGDGPGVVFFDDASIQHPDSHGDGGVPAVIMERGGTYLPGTLGRIGVVLFGGVSL